MRRGTMKARVMMTKMKAGNKKMEKKMMDREEKKKMAMAFSKSEPKKGQKSKTMKGKEDFTTKRGNKDFDRDGKREKTAEGSKVKRKPFTKKTHMMPDGTEMTGATHSKDSKPVKKRKSVKKKDKPNYKL